MNSSITWKTICLLFLLWMVPIAAPSQTFTTLANFDGTDGIGSFSSLTQGFDGNLYGTTALGGTNTLPICSGSCGTVFKVTPSGMLTGLYDFCSLPGCADGFTPEAGVVQASDGNLYGTTLGTLTADCSSYACGTVFIMSPEGTVKTLHTFDGADGKYPQAGLVQGTDGNFYGTTRGGGSHNASYCISDCGTVFKITHGTLTTLYSFCSQAACADGVSPYAGLVQGADGSFYGTTVGGGVYMEGTLFKITPQGLLTVLYQFCSKAECADGAEPEATLVQGTDGNFYGTTFAGGTNNVGTVFKITAGGRLTTLYSFCSEANCRDGAYLELGGLVQATDGNLYGVTNFGGTTGGLCNTAGCGTIFKITPSGTFTTIHRFSGSDGSDPEGAPVQATDGTFYATTLEGGTSNDGVVYSLNLGLSPFVSSLRSSGKTGQTVQILGQGFTGATGVSFNGASAAFTVISDTYLTATVPVGAITGAITVTEPGGSLQSNVPFRVTPQISAFSPTSGPVGTSVVITGQSFTGATVVTFDCKWQASFTVNSDTRITATVPLNATIGTVTVRTAGGAIESVDKFTVTP